MRKESATIRKCHSRLSSLGLDSTVAFHKSKLILKIYRDVVWVLSERAQELQEYAWELGDQDLSTGLCYLENFAPDMSCTMRSSASNSFTVSIVPKKSFWMS